MYSFLGSILPQMLMHRYICFGFNKYRSLNWIRCSNLFSTWNSAYFACSCCLFAFVYIIKHTCDLLFKAISKNFKNTRNKWKKWREKWESVPHSWYGKIFFITSSILTRAICLKKLKVHTVFEPDNCLL